MLLAPNAPRNRPAGMKSRAAVGLSEFYLPYCVVRSHHSWHLGDSAHSHYLTCLKVPQGTLVGIQTAEVRCHGCEDVQMQPTGANRDRVDYIRSSQNYT